MASASPLGLYDRHFSQWLEKRAKALSPRRCDVSGVAPRRYGRLDVTRLLRREFDPGTLARLDALGLAS